MKAIPATIHEPIATMLHPWFPGLTGAELVEAIKTHRQRLAAGPGARNTGKMLTVPEVMERLRISRSSIYNRIKDGTLPRVKVGGATRIPESAVLAFSNLEGN